MSARNPLTKWLALDWERPERAYNPEVRDFLAGVLAYPKDRVVTEDSGGGGYPDIKLLTTEKIAWVVGDLKKDDRELTELLRWENLWQEKRKYIEGLTQYVLFLTAHYLWVVLPTGSAVVGFEQPCNLSEITLAELQEKLQFMAYAQANHEQQWAGFLEGQFPYAYLQLDTPELLERLRQDLHLSFTELCASAEGVMARLCQEYKEFQHQEQELKRNLVAAAQDTQRRALVKLQLKSDFHRHLFEETLPRFEDQYGRDINARGNQIAERIRESFVADSVAVLVARVLFLRLIEDLNLTSRRRLSDGGPRDWAAFVEQLTGDAKALIELVSKNMGRLYQEPFQPNLFDWIYETNGVLDQVLQRLILRFNAYDFSGLSEEILGDIYQNFLPPAKRKRLGEFYTPPSIVDWILEQTVFQHGEGDLLDPSCGSGSFLVRYVHRCLADAKRRGLNGDTVVQDLQTHTWGFDLNPFATFISYFQLMWALVRFKPANQPNTIPKIHIHNLNSLVKDDDLVPLLGEDFFPPGSLARDRHQWKYILGNPPYIRAERVKYGEEMRGLWQPIWGQNSDTGLVFLYRSLTEWLTADGFLGMVVSGGYANSEAAARVWKLLYPGRIATLKKVVWLEFVGRLWDAAAIPLLLIIEKRPAQIEDEIELYVPSQWPSDQPPVNIRYGDFFDPKVNPKVTEVQGNGSDYWGDYLLPLLHPQDIPILQKLYPNGNGGNFVELKSAVQRQMSRNNRPFWFTYGIQRGGVEVTPEPTGERPIQVLAGRNISMAWAGEPVGWVDLEAVKNRPNGKLSLWAENNPSTFIVVPTLSKAMFASIIKLRDNQEIAVINTVLLAIPKSEVSAKIVTAYLNSKLARFYSLVRLRSAVLEGSSRATFYPRTLEALPWVRHLDPTIEQQLVADYDELARLAAIAKNNPDEWLLSEVENRIGNRRYKLSERRLGLNFLDWSPEDVPVEELTLDGSYIRAGLFYFQLLDADLAELVYKLLTLNTDEDTLISKAIIQKLVIPQDYPDVMATYRQRLIHFQQVESDFFAVLNRIDHTIAI
ncbi:N-6 DNA methylase family [Gloeomargarita lithophora Alchichica-D10]|uniref:N-6 DNA methylase family n=1 Tax=Gloeomargarita lithophora Alchichica-D10 TaxID=1188229 RepID=A0A1J0A8U4_9CYAN|nr:N-6 DNA methylase [Gloeomargarita lithophora]APB32329.1 N-6 DNA methylase family [Gloeomargarita lithophora Alchichica-D10]